MEYVCLGLALLLGGSYVVCSIAEFFLWIFERHVSDNFTPEFGDGTARSFATLPPITQTDVSFKAGTPFPWYMHL